MFGADRAPAVKLWERGGQANVNVLGKGTRG